MPWLVAAVRKPSRHVFERDRGHRLRDRLVQRLAGARRSLPDDVLYLRERFFYRVEVRRVGGKEHHIGAPGFDELPDSLGSVRPELVQHDDLSGLKRRGQELLDVSLEEFRVGRTLDCEGLAHPSFSRLIAAIRVWFLPRLPGTLP